MSFPYDYVLKKISYFDIFGFSNTVMSDCVDFEFK